MSILLCDSEVGDNMLNKRGMTVVEIIVSIALISVVLIFLMKIFINLRGVTNQSKTDLNYEMLAANVIKAVGKDINKYTVYKVERLDEHSIRITFNDYRPTSLDERISKVLKVYESGDKLFISYAYDSETLTGGERSEAVIREIPDKSILDETTRVQLKPSKDIFKDDKDIFEIKIPLSTDKSVVYDINIFGVIEKK